MMNMNRLGPTMELRWKFYKTKKEANEGEYGEDVVGWGRHLYADPKQMLEFREGREMR